jgi:SAM-dependent methyltransferase
MHMAGSRSEKLRTPMDALAPLSGIMQRHGVRCSPEEFHAAVNVAFHQNESEVYDELHQDMWESLPRQFTLLAADCAAAGLPSSEPIRMLDIGCGTGLASDCILKSALGARVRSVVLLDTSSAMLQRAGARASGWGVTVTIHEGTLDQSPPQKYDLIVTCSVLHHVPDVPAFLADVAARLAPGGVFLHLQDPNGEALGKATLTDRMKRIPSPPPEWVGRLTPSRILNRLRRELTGKQGQDYISKTNRELLRMSIVTTPLSVPELFSITDIHVQDGEGISIGKMTQWMNSWELISTRSYGYFGQLASTLPPSLQREEAELSAQRDSNGMYVSAAWRMA